MIEKYMPTLTGIYRASVLIVILVCTSAAAQSPVLLKDLNTRPNSAVQFAGEIVATAQLLYFSGTDPANGSEIWVSDGTPEGTKILKDLNPGPENSFPSGFTAVSSASGQLVYFSATTPQLGRELWRTDGTPDGTFPIDINPGTAHSIPTTLTAFGATLLFSAETATSGRELWLSAGTAPTTSMLIDIYPGVEGGMRTDAEIVIVPGTLRALFPALNQTSGLELWQTNGIITQMVSELAPNSASSQPTNLLAMPGLGMVYFSATDGVNGRSIYSSDGITISPVRLFPRFLDSNLDGPSDLAKLTDSTFLFTANTLATGRELWRSNGTTNGTGPVVDLTNGPDSSFREFRSGRLESGNGVVFFVIDLPVENPPPGIFVTDGTAGGTKEISDARATFEPRSYSRFSGGKFFFRGENEEAGIELFSSDGTAQGTKVEADLRPGFLSSSPVALTEFKSELYFFADSASGASLFKTVQGVTTRVTDFTIPGTRSSSPSVGSNSVISGNKMYFLATDGDLGFEPFISDGTPDGTGILKDLRPGLASGSPGSLLAYKGGVVFTVFTPNEGEELWTSDGTEGGTKLIKDINPGGENSVRRNQIERFVLGDKVVFTADDGARGQELWSTDGTLAGTQIVKDINLGAGTGVADQNEPSEFAVLGNFLYFAGNDSGSSVAANRELWRSDGTEAGTTKVKEINVQPNGSSGPRFFEPLPSRGIVLFQASAVGSDFELWKSDGTETGTALVKDIFPVFGSSPRDIRAIGDVAVFNATTPGDLGQELWVTDGTETGTLLLKDIWPGTSSSNPRGSSVLGNRLFFNANDGVTGEELWVTDGTVAGTTQFKDLNPGPLSSFSGSFVAAGDTTYFRVFFFTADNGSNSKLFKTDGTPAGTVEVPTPGLTLGSNPFSFRGRLFMTFLDPLVGFEPYSILFDACPDDSNKIDPGSCGCGVADSDSNGNGTLDCLEVDACPDDAAKTVPGTCGCGVADVDTNANGVLDCLEQDGCPSDPAKIAGGVCGCNIADSDTNSNGTVDCLEQDACPLDNAKVVAGVCGCGLPDNDTNANGVFDCNEDLCPLDPGKIAPGTCGCGRPDSDTNLNGIPDCSSNADLKAQLNGLLQAIKQVKSPNNKKQKAAQKVLKIQIRTSLAGFGEFRKVNSAGITVTGKTSIAKLGSMVEKRVRKALKIARTFKGDKKQAVAAIKKLVSVL